jgi:hypothetical protein
VVTEFMVSGRVHGHAVKGSNSYGGAFSVVPGFTVPVRKRIHDASEKEDSRCQ